MPSAAFCSFDGSGLNSVNHASFPFMAAFPTARTLLISVGYFAGLIGDAHSGPAVAEPLLELPKLTVTDVRRLPPPEPWRYAQIPGFEILSAASDRETQKLLRDFQLFNE